MTSKTPKDQDKPKDRPARPTQPTELETLELDKVVGGLMTNTAITRPTSGLKADPCEGGE